MKKLGVVLFALGGPDSLKAIKPFLLSLFQDPKILPYPWFLRFIVSHIIVWARLSRSRAAYAEIGGASPLSANTAAQARALEKYFGGNVRVVVALRYEKGSAKKALKALQIWGAKKLVLLPLYPQFSTTTTGSSFAQWGSVARGLKIPCKVICCYPTVRKFSQAHVALLKDALKKTPAPRRILFSAHGLPLRIVRAGDPYPRHVESSCRGIMEVLGQKEDWRVCYQSKVGPMRWLKPSLQEEIAAAGKDKRNVLVVPVSFVSEHLETLRDLDKEAARWAVAAGIKHYKRVPALGTHRLFVEVLGDLVEGKASVCPRGFHKV